MPRAAGARCKQITPRQITRRELHAPSVTLRAKSNESRIGLKVE
nr:MAG TPA: hypothetical protein [Caudoviricetes sp.]